MTMNDTWGYKSYDHNWKSTETLIRNLVDIASKGGNYLLNVGPTCQGVIPAAERRAAPGDRQVDEGQRRGDLRHDRQPVQPPALGPLHEEAERRRGHALPARLRLADGRQAGRAGPAQRGPQRLAAGDGQDSPGGQRGRGPGRRGPGRAAGPHRHGGRAGGQRQARYREGAAGPGGGWDHGATRAAGGNPRRVRPRSSPRAAGRTLATGPTHATG